MPFEQKKGEDWVQVTEREVFISLSGGSFRFPALAMEQMENNPMQVVADLSIDLQLRFNPTEPQPCTC